MNTRTASALVVILLAFSSCKYADTADAPSKDKTSKSDKKDKKEKKSAEETADLDVSSLQVSQRWDMPDVLTEISDIENIDDHSFACVQDESGVIYIYNLDNKKIEKEISFAGKGDYEGITLAGKTAYVINSSGVIYEVSDISTAKPAIKQYKTSLTSKDDVEAICFDKQNNRLLIAFKGKEGNGETKGIYSFNLSNKTLENNPVYSIDLETLPGAAKSKKKKQNIKPSAIAIHPQTGDMYILEGTVPKLLITDKQGKTKSLVALDRSIFVQPEGITFNSAGEMFISNEGQKGKGNILKVK